MTSAHLIFIPLVLVVGMIIGFIFGGRVARDAYNRELVRDKQREENRKEREARKAAAAGKKETSKT
jgi:Na+/glutamate symporter